MTLLLEDATPVAVLDDTRDDAELTAELLEEAGLDPIIFEPSETIAETIAHMRSATAAAVCDHRLKNLVSYTGAEVVDSCLQEGWPAVLLTTFANTDGAEIQRHRVRIPKLLKRGEESNPAALRDALTTATGECNGQFTEDRRPFRTIVRVSAVSAKAGQVAEVFVPAWSSRDAILVPADQIVLQSGVPIKKIAGRSFFANVNLHATDVRDLYFDDFELLESAPDDFMG